MFIIHPVAGDGKAFPFRPLKTLDEHLSLCLPARLCDDAFGNRVVKFMQCDRLDLLPRVDVREQPFILPVSADLEFFPDPRIIYMDRVEPENARFRRVGAGG